MQGAILANRYLLAEPIGFGGMGAVYRATDLRTGGPVAVKLLHATLAQDPGYVRRLRREAELAASLTSPRVVRVIDVDTDASTPFLVMEFVPGPTLGELVRESGRLPPDEALRIAIEVGRALAAAQAAGIVHRDLKPDNIKIVDGQVKVLDFGIARLALADGPTITGEYLGTPEYSAPEQLDGRGDIRSDIYALGVILFRLVEGDLPFTGPTPFAVLQQHLSAPVPAMQLAPPRLAVVVRRCLEKRPEDRYQTPEELIAALQAAQATVSAPPLAAPPGGPIAPAEPEPDPAAASPARSARTRRLERGGGRPPARATTAATVAAPTGRPPRRAPGRRTALMSAVAVVVLAVLAIAGLIAVLGRGGDGEEAGQVEAAGTVAGGSGWLRAGSARTDSGGSWRFKQTVPRDLIADGFIRTRLVAGTCATAPDDAVAFEGTVPSDQLGRDLWEVFLYPGGKATGDPRFQTSGAAFLQQQPNGRTNVEIALDGLPPRLTLNVCFRQQ
jgi:serine/threonine-protein kinase